MIIYGSKCTVNSEVLRNPRSGKSFLISRQALTIINLEPFANSVFTFDEELNAYCLQLNILMPVGKKNSALIFRSKNLTKLEL